MHSGHGRLCFDRQASNFLLFIGLKLNSGYSVQIRGVWCIVVPLEAKEQLSKLNIVELKLRQVHSASAGGIVFKNRETRVWPTSLKYPCRYIWLYVSRL